MGVLGPQYQDNISQNRSRIRNRAALAADSASEDMREPRFISPFRESAKSAGQFCHPASIPIAPGCMNVGSRPGTWGAPPPPWLTLDKISHFVEGTSLCDVPRAATPYRMRGK